MTPVLLASQSPRRQALLTQIGITPIVVRPPADFDTESLETVWPDETPHDYVLRVAQNKRSAFQQFIERKEIVVPRPAVLLTADTTVTIDNAILGKPQTKAEAAAMLRALSGRRHQVLTAIAAVHLDTHEQQEQVVCSEVEFAMLSDAWITRYVDSGEPMDKAGGYGIQGAAGTMIPKIHGSMSAIMGLPLYETQMMLISLGVSIDPLH
jgi:septum formation protein